MPKDIPVTKQVPASERTTCEATRQMLEKARKDGVILNLDRAVDMKACPIGVESACCKHCFMGPCRLNPRDPYKKSVSAVPPSILSRPAIWQGMWPQDRLPTMTMASTSCICSKTLLKTKSRISPSPTHRNLTSWPSLWALTPKTGPCRKSAETCTMSWKRPFQCGR